MHPVTDLALRPVLPPLVTERATRHAEIAVGYGACITSRRRATAAEEGQLLRR